MAKYEKIKDVGVPVFCQVCQKLVRVRQYGTTIRAQCDCASKVIKL